MEYARKVALVPTDQLSLLTTQARHAEVLTPGWVRNVVTLDDEMRTILNRGDLDGDTKMKLYYATLQRYLEQRERPMTRELPKPTSLEAVTESEPKPEPQPGTSGLKQEGPSPLTEAEQRMLEALSRSKAFHWDDQGQVYDRRSRIKNANIFKLVKRLSAPDPLAGKRLAGLERAIRELQIMKVPGPWLKKDPTWETMGS